MHASLHPTALVLGGGGSAGNAWLIGILAGLADAGADVTDADLIIGTSAGATAAAQITSASLGDLYALTIARIPAGVGPNIQRSRPGMDHLERTGRIIAESTDPADMRRRMGASALALEASSDPEAQARWRATVAARLPRADWPDRRIQITAVEARSGEPVVFDRDSGVDLVDAVAASTAGGFAYSIAGVPYIDGGYRTNAENADLAAGCARVLVLSPFGGRSRFPAVWGVHLADQVDALRAAGTEVEVIGPEARATAAFGDNMMDLSTRRPAAEAGFAHGRCGAAEIGGVWT